MSPSTIILVIQEFFNDIIGSIVPGGLLIYGVGQVLGYSLVPRSGFDWILFFAGAYVIGHALTRLSYWLSKWLRRSDDPDTRLDERIKESGSFHQFKQLVPAPESSKVNELRNVAMTLIGEEKHTVYRFRFLGIFNGNSAIALGILAILITILIIVAALGGIALPVSIGNAVAIALVSFLLAVLLWQNSTYFYGVSRRVPFDMAVANLAGAMRTRTNPSYSQVIKTVYLAGGHKTGWQDSVTSAAPQAQFLDPRSHGLKDPKEFTRWDLAAIEKCDLVFAYLENTNPGGYAMSLEIGYAKALGKYIIFVDERTEPTEAAGGKAYLDMVRAASDQTFSELEDGVAALTSELRREIRGSSELSGPE